MRLVHHMKLAHKFLILGPVFLTLVAVPTGGYFSRSLTDIGIARRELQGTSPLVVQVVRAVTQMDQVTQQNAALVKEIAAAADSLHRQSQQLLKTVSAFKW